jgi:hypothetical protein
MRASKSNGTGFPKNELAFNEMDLAPGPVAEAPTRALGSNGTNHREEEAEPAELDFAPAALGRERRKRLRVGLHWPICLWRDVEASPLVTTTENLSSGGFYCFSDEPFRPEEQLHCLLRVPAQNPADREDALYLTFLADVVRVEMSEPAGQFGIACRVRNHHVAQREAWPAVGRNVAAD